MLTLLLATLAFAGTNVIGKTASGFSWTTLKSADDPVKVVTFTTGKVEYSIKCTQTVCNPYKGSTKVSSKVTVEQVGKGINFGIGNNTEHGWSNLVVQWGEDHNAPALTLDMKLGGTGIKAYGN